MRLLVLFLLLLLFLNNNYAISQESNYHINKKVELPFVIFICENCQKNNQKIKINYDVNNVKKISDFLFVVNHTWSTDAQSILEKEQDSEFQILGTRSWPPQIPFSISPLNNKNGLVVFINYSGEMKAKTLPVLKKYVLFYNKKAFIASSEELLQSILQEELPKLNKQDGIRLYISKEVSGSDLSTLQDIIKSFTSNKNSLIIPYDATSDGVRYRTDIDISQRMRAVKKINQFVPNLSAHVVSGTNDAIEISRSK